MEPTDDTTRFSRREFVKLLGLTGAALALPADFMRAALAAGSESVDASTIIRGKVPGMIVHNAKLGVMETPVSLLREHDITPKNILYNRTHFPVSGSRAWTATTEPPHFDHWTVDVSGLVQRPRQVSLADLKDMEQTRLTAVMQCAGNGRHYYAAKAKAPGSQWRHGGLANLQWEGVPLRAFLENVDVGMSSEVRYLTANGADDPPVRKGQDLIKSYHIEDPALDHAILALKMNGEPIPAIHGGPVRLVIPGFYGNMSVKFVNQLLLENMQSPSDFQSRAYRVPYKHVEPGEFTIADFTIENSRPTYNFAIMSVIFAPLATDSVQAGPVKVRGVAWNDGSVPITAIEVSKDGGKSWTQAGFEKPDSPFAWYQWRTQLPLEKGDHELMVRATDAEGRTQPINGNVRWNPKGYEWNGVDRVKVSVT
jgi:DMSO/TMAO reductase YedYZ molybdopterin-dependent catalytic subunit